MRPHFSDLEWYKKAGFLFSREFSNQGLDKLVSLKGPYYPKLVKVFYTCLKVLDDGELM